MRYILIIIIIAFIGCKEEKPTENQITSQEKYTIDELEQDTNWVEIIEIDTLENYCVKKEYRLGGILIKDHQEYTELYQMTKDDVECPSNSNSLNVNFNDRDVIMAAFSNAPSNWTRKIFKNEKTNEIRYIVEIMRINSTEKFTWWYEAISIPKINTKYQFNIDTLHFRTD